MGIDLKPRLLAVRHRDSRPSVNNDLRSLDAFSHGFGQADPVVNDELDLRLTNISNVSVDVRRARMGCHATVNVISDGPATVQFGGCHRTIQVGG